MLSVFFIGHRDAPEALRLLLDKAVERHISEYGVTDFVVGHYGHFDTMAARSVREAKQRHPEVTLTLLIPYYPFRGLSELSKDFDATFYPPGLENVPKPHAIVRANEYMIQTSSYLICYDRGQIGKTRDYVAFARKREQKGLIHIENLAETM